MAASVKTAKSSVLRTNLTNAQGIVAKGVDGVGVAAHHIVAGTHRWAARSRQILARWGIDINDAVNGVFLPSIVHKSIHNAEYFRRVEALLESAATRDGAIFTLRWIADEILAGRFP